MKIKKYSFLLIIALVLSACGSFVTESSTESAPAPISPELSETETAGALLIWESADLPCERVSMRLEGLSSGECGGSLTSVPTQITNHSARLSELSSLYASFSADTPAGDLIFKGTGSLIPTDA